jgi:DNA-directed RNA polymerase specialized sigma24 family protein
MPAKESSEGGKTATCSPQVYWGQDRQVAEFRFGDIDVVELFERLTLHAYTLYGCFPSPHFSPVLRGCGDSPEDLAKEIITKLLDPDDRTVKWPAGRGKTTKAALLGYLKEALTHDFIDRKRLKRYTTTAEWPPAGTDDPNGTSFDELAVYLTTPEAVAIRNECYDQLLSYLADEPDLRDLLTIQLTPEAYQAYTNQEVGKLLDITVDEVENRKKRLQRRLLKFQKQRARGQTEE